MECANNYNKIYGCLIGGAIGDALGYPVEFLCYKEILNRFGSKGITEFVLKNGLAEISDDTQMTLFTAESLLFATTRFRLRGIIGSPEDYTYSFYLHWLKTQGRVSEALPACSSWLVNVDQLNNTRAPGNTCLRSLINGKMGTVENSINDSKGCGTVMRVAPIGLYCRPERVFEYGVNNGALTHGHPLGYLSSGLLAFIISGIINVENCDLESIINSSNEYLKYMQKKNGYDERSIAQLSEIISKAISLSHSDIKPIDAIEQIGEGWVAEEALAIAVYCSLKNTRSFENAIIDAVNHSGDSDSTGAITGNIMGAYLGFSSIPEKFIENLELKEVIEEISKDLSSNITVSEFSNDDTEEERIWLQKYLYGSYKKHNTDL